MSTLRNLSKRYGMNMNRLPHFYKKMFEQLSAQSQLPALRPDAKEVAEDDRFSSYKEWQVAVGDRVLITKGKYRGTITKVVGLHESTNRLYLEHSETRRIVVPKQFWQKNQDSHVIDYPQTVHPKDVKVVGTITDEVSGEDSDIAAHALVFKGEYWDEDYKKMMSYRRIRYNEHIIIPWPRPDIVEDDAFSTPELHTVERTYTPMTIASNEMPEGVIQSLRDPIAKRPYKWGKKQVTKSDLYKLSTPQMPISEAKKAFKSEITEIKSKEIKEIPNDVMEFIGSKVADHLNNITEPALAKYIESVGPEYKNKKIAKKEKEREVYKAKDEAKQRANKRKEELNSKYYPKKSGNHVW
ncbi:hypothetical protein B5S31_g1070 [[Candida] boidinii]|nr:hypothetical protein B5S31_g1070 [[Candida] boidinii]